MQTTELNFDQLFFTLCAAYCNTAEWFQFTEAVEQPALLNVQRRRARLLQTNLFHVTYLV